MSTVNERQLQSGESGGIAIEEQFRIKLQELGGATGSTKVALLEQISSLFAKENTPPNLVVVKGTDFVFRLAEVMRDNPQWAKDEPKWLVHTVESIYYFMQWDIPLEQTTLLLDVTKSYLLQHESAFAITLLHRILTPITNEKLVLSDPEIYEILKNIVIAAGGTHRFNALRCLQAAVLHSLDWQLKILQDTKFIIDLVHNDPTPEIWAFLSIVAQHYDAKALFPPDVLEKAKVVDNEFGITICAILCDEADDLTLNYTYVEDRVKRLEELLNIMHDKGKVFRNSLLSLVLPFVNLSISDQNKAFLGEKLVRPLLRVMAIEKDRPLIAKIENCLERSKQEASRVLWHLAFLPENLNKIEEAGGLDLLHRMKDTTDSKVKRNVTGMLYMFSQREVKMAPIPTEPRGHVMISYNWANQQTIKRLAVSLQQLGYRIWVDYEQMEGSTLETMAQAVEGSAVILMCFTQKYKDSPNCKLEAEYCMKRGINFIPLRLQKGYKPDGWLGIAIGNKLYHDFTSEDNWQDKMDKLTKVMGGAGRTQSTIVSTIEALQKQIERLQEENRMKAEENRLKEEAKVKKKQEKERQAKEKEEALANKYTDNTKLSANKPQLQNVKQPGSRRITRIPLRDIKIGKELGKGGQAVVYHAEWRGMHVVFKKLYNKTNEMTNPEFAQELSTWMDATYPCVAMYGVVDEGDTFGFIAEYCQHGSLDVKFNEGIVVSGVQSVDIACNVASALNQLHAMRITHRDVKCANVMLDGNFNGRLGDFGISKSLGTCGVATAVGSGTFTHIAPEEILEVGNQIDPLAAEVYSFGVLMRELAINKVAINRKLDYIPDTPIGLPEAVRKAWWTTIQQCTQAKPENRPTIVQIQNMLVAMRNSIKDFKCKKHNKAAHDMFISYRVAADKDIILIDYYLI